MSDTYDIAKRVEKAAPELGVRAYKGEYVHDDIPTFVVAFPDDESMGSDYERRRARLLLLGVLQEWADGAGYNVVRQNSSKHAIMLQALPLGDLAHTFPDTRLEALTLCLEHWAASKEEA